MIFNDPAFGVTFTFPSGWSFARVAPNSRDTSLGIAYLNGRTVSNGLRGLVTNETLPGIHSWPKTVFSSVAFGYDARPADSAQACQALVRGNWEQDSAPVTLNGVTYWHGTASSADLSTKTAEDIYATFVVSNGSCIRFDLAVATSHVPGKEMPRPLTEHEKALVQASLHNILNSVHIAAAAR
jgi:hypothetical protein